MTIIIGGKTVNTGAEVDTNSAALAVVQRPMAIAAQIPSTGAYTLGMDNGATAMTAGAQTDAEIYQWRWTDTRSACVLRSVKMSCGASVAFAAGRLKFDLILATQYTASGSGGTTPTLTGRNAAKRTSFPMTAAPASAIRIATTAALTAGTRTLDTSPLGTLATGATGTIGAVFDPQRPIWQRDTSDEHPVVFGYNEGFVIRVTCPATGTWFFSVNVEWEEIEARSYLG